MDLYLSGHDHNQQLISFPGEPLYAISGGGGQDLYAIDHLADELKYSAVEDGFIKVTAKSRSLTIGFYNDKGTATQQSTLKPNCTLGDLARISQRVKSMASDGGQKRRATSMDSAPK